MNKFVEYGMNDFLISINYKKNMIKSYFGDTDHTYNVSFVEEDKPLGTGGSLHLMKDDLKEQFFVSNCDILIDADYSDVVDFHNKNNLDITMVASLKNDQIPYGVLQLDEEGLLESSEEKPEFSYLVNTGMYLLENSILDFTERTRDLICFGETVTPIVDEDFDMEANEDFDIEDDDDFNDTDDGISFHYGYGNGFSMELSLGVDDE